MKRFVFTLQTILNLREKEEEMILHELAEKENEFQKANEEFANIQQELVDFQQQQKESRLKQDATALRNSVSWRQTLKMRVLKKGQDVQDIHLDIESVRKRLIVATQKRKSLELLKDKHKAAWQKEFDRKEQEFLDELAQNQHRLKQK